MKRARLENSGIAATAVVFVLLAMAAAEQANAAISGGAVPIVVVTAGKPTEHAFELSAKSVKHGTVIFKLINVGKVSHGFQIAGYSTKLVRPRRSTALRVTFKAPGKYVYQCVVTYGSVDDVSNTGPMSVDNPAKCASGVLTVT